MKRLNNLKNWFYIIFCLIAVNVLFAHVASAQGVLLVNSDIIHTDNTMVFDADDSGGDIKLQFGNILNEQLKWEDADDSFSFTDDLFIEGRLQIGDGDTGDITIDETDGFYRESGSGFFRFGNNAANPQFYLGDPTGAANGWIDVENGAALNLNTLEGGAGPVVIGDGGLEPETNGVTGFGTAVARWGSAYVSSLDVSGDITLGGELNNARVENLASEPICDALVKGKIYHNTTDTYTYICDGSSWKQLDLTAGVIGNTLVTVQARNSDGFTLTNQDQWYDITFNKTDVETDSTVVDHNVVNTERIDIKEDGTYLITYVLDAVDAGVAHQIQARLYKNGTTQIPGSYLEAIDAANEHTPLTATVVTNLIDGDYITLQAIRLTANIVVGQPNINITKLDGIKGDKGDPGSAGSGTDYNTFTLDEDDTGGNIDLRFGTTLDERLKWNATNSEFEMSDDLNLEYNQLKDARIQNSATAPTTCSSSTAGMQWMDTDTGNVFVCDTSNGRNKWLSIHELVIWGDESGSCSAGSDPGSNSNCNVDWGNGLGADASTDLGLYIPYPATITGYGFSADNDACISGSFDVELWSTGSGSDDNNYSLASTIASGLTGEAHNSRSLNLDLIGDEYILWGIDNNCGESIDDFNVIVYFKWKN